MASSQESLLTYKNFLYSTAKKACHQILDFLGKWHNKKCYFNMVLSYISPVKQAEYSSL